MPSHTIQSAFIKLYHANGAPWSWKTWKDITGIHDGIFPPDDTLIPKGLTRKDVTDIQSYFAQYEAQPSEDAKIKFAAGSKGNPIPGRTKWRDWMTAGWKAWKIHSRISDMLTTEDLHPLTIMANNDNSLPWPQGDLYIPLAVDSVALNLFGEESLDSSGRLAAQFRPITQHIVQRTWINISKQTKRNKVRLVALEDAATKAFNGKRSFSCWFFFFSEFHRHLRHEKSFTLTRVRRTPIFLLLVFTIWIIYSASCGISGVSILLPQLSVSLSETN